MVSTSTLSTATHLRALAACTVALLLLKQSVWRVISRQALTRILPHLSGVWARMPSELKTYIQGALFVSLPVGFIGTIGGSGYALFRLAVDRFYYLLHRYCQVTLVITNKDKHYDSIVDYIGLKCEVETGRILATTQPRKRPSFQEMLAFWLGGKEKAPTLYYQPDIAGFSDWFVWSDSEGREHKIWIRRDVEKPQFASNDKHQKEKETINLTMWWTRDNSVLKEFLETALRTMLKDDGGSTVDIYVKHMWLAMWTKAIAREKRDRDTVILDEGQADMVVEDMRHFFSEKTAGWYRNAGIPYRRGYLLYGPPGCGKTSFAQVLAGELGLDVCLMNLSNSDMNDDDLAELLRAAPAKSMLLLEDVDAIFVERTAAAGKKERGGGVSFSGLLNALDGAAAQEGCVIMLTTNHKDRLDEALIRPGRCDVHVKIDKASKDQAKRMFWRFFAKENVIKSCENGVIVCPSPHRLSQGSSVFVKQVATKGNELTLQGHTVDPRVPLYVRVIDSNRLTLHNSEKATWQSGPDCMLKVAGGKGVKLQEILEAGQRFSNRIPERQVSMAKLQGYLMKQKLHSEQELMKKREAADTANEAANLGISEETMRSDEVHELAAESAVINVHELLDVRQETEEVQLDIFDHFRRVGLHNFASVFEYHGVLQKKDISGDLAQQMENWLPDLKMNNPCSSRLKRLLSGDEKLDSSYDFADLSILRDRFISHFRDAPADGKASNLPPPPVELTRASSLPAKADDVITRKKLLEATGFRENEGLKLLEMAHEFQERLEDRGKTNISMWQLEMHFQRYAGDPHGALENCSALRKLGKDREPKKFVPMTMFAFLRRIGLEKHAFGFENSGFELWADCVSLDKDKLKEHGGMGEQDAKMCHALLSNNTARSDLLRKFQRPEFADLIMLFRQRFPESSRSLALQFARKLTDELGVTDFSFHQVEAYLKDARTPAAALRDTSDGLPTLEVAESLRKKPAPPEPPEPPTCWVYTWLKEKEMEGHADFFIRQQLQERKDVLDAPIDHKALTDFGIAKLGDRCRLLRLLEDEKAKPAPASAEDQEASHTGAETSNGAA